MKKINYETYWDGYVTHSRHPSVRLRNNHIINEIRRLKFNSLIDVGCGDGFLANLIKSQFPDKKISGTDVSNKILIINSEKYPEIDFYQSDITSNSFNIEKHYDIVVCSEVIEHLVEWKTSLKYLSVLLKKEGYLILTTQSGKKYKSDINNGHINHFELQILENELSKYGIKFINSFKKGFPFLNMQKWLYEKIESTALGYERGDSGNTLFGRILFNLTYQLFRITPRSKKLGQQIFILAQKM